MTHNAIDNAVKRLKRQNAEKRERWKRANSNPLIWFPVRLLAARGSLVVSANSNIVVPTGKGYNIRSSKGLPGILKVRDWINEAYQLCFDILEDPWQVAYDELLAADEEEIFLNWPNGMNNLVTPWWSWLMIFGFAIAGGVIGGLLGSRLIKKHFEKAGVV